MDRTPSNSTVQDASMEDEVEQHEQDVEDKEALEYWGFMFKADKTGTDRLKALLRGLKAVMVSTCVESCSISASGNCLSLEDGDEQLIVRWCRGDDADMSVERAI